MDADELPPGWAWATLGELGQVSGGLTQNASRKGASIQIPFLRVGNVQSGVVDLSDLREIGVEESELPRTLLEAGDLLIVEGNGSIEQVGRCAIWTGKIQRCVHQNHIIKLRLSKCVSPSYVSHWLSSISGRARIERVASSKSGLHTLSISKIADLEIPLAPSVEQIKIVNEIKLLFDELVEAEAALARAREGVEQFRASLLHAACTGQLTAEWRAANKPTETGADLLRRILAERRAAWERSERARLEAKGTPPIGNAWKARYVEPVGPNLKTLAELPDGWTWANLGQLTGRITSGSRDWGNHYSDEGPVLVRAQNIKRDIFDISGLAHVTSPGGIGEARTAIQLHDLLITITGANVTKSAVVDIDVGEAYVSQHVGLCRLTFTEMAIYVHLAIICGSFGRKQLAEAAYGAGKPGLNLQDLARVDLPIPPLLEQFQIIRLVDRLMDASRLPSVNEKSDIGSMNSLRQSILHAAFSGRLIPQDPSDEPASVLLARLGSAAPQTCRRRRIKPKASA